MYAAATKGEGNAADEPFGGYPNRNSDIHDPQGGDWVFIRSFVPRHDRGTSSLSDSTVWGKRT